VTLDLNAQLLNAKQVAEFLNVSLKTVYGWVNRDQIIYIKINGSIRFKRQDIESLIND
jgi:excisionase family DNA binding protein